jgi:hypothetical protein
MPTFRRSADMRRDVDCKLSVANVKEEASESMRRTLNRCVALLLNRASNHISSSFVQLLVSQNSPIAMASKFLVLAMLAVPAFTQNVTYKTGDTTGCISLSHVQALGQTYNLLTSNNTQSDGLALPAIPDEYINSPAACIPESLFDKYFEPIVAISKEESLLSNLDNVLSIHDTAIHKRARSCPEIKSAAQQKASSLSCNSAPHPSACRSCANFSSINFVAACVACAAKANQESIFCCAAAATTFITYYSQVCLEK